MNKLEDELAAAEAARRLYAECCLLVWREVEATHPELAETITGLGLDDGAVAEWICTPGPTGHSPAALIAAGQADEVKSVVMRTLHGFTA